MLCDVVWYYFMFFVWCDDVVCCDIVSMLDDVVCCDCRTFGGSQYLFRTCFDHIFGSKQHHGVKVALNAHLISVVVLVVVVIGMWDDGLRLDQSRFD